MRRASREMSTARRAPAAESVAEFVASRRPANRRMAKPEKMKPVLRYAEKLTYSPNGVTRADADAVLAAGWNEAALYYAVAVTALFNFMNRIVEGLGIALDPAYVKPPAERLADRGYLPLIEMLER